MLMQPCKRGFAQMNSNLFVACFRCTATRYRPTKGRFRSSAPRLRTLETRGDAGGQGEHRWPLSALTQSDETAVLLCCTALLCCSAVRLRCDAVGSCSWGSTIAGAAQRSVMQCDTTRHTYESQFAVSRWLCRCECASVTRDRAEAPWLKSCATSLDSTCLGLACVCLLHCHYTVPACSF